MKKKILAIFLAMSMMIMSTACGGNTASSKAEISEADTSEAEIPEADTPEEETLEADTAETDTSEAETTETDTFEPGTFDGSTYTNTSVGIKATMPDGFAEISSETMTGVSNEAVVQAEDGSAIQIFAEDMQQTIGRAVSAEEYLSSMKDQVDMQYGAVGFLAEATDLGTVTIGGVDFYGLSIAVSGGMEPITQNYYIITLGDTMFCILTTATDDMTAVMDQFINTIEATE